jgi:uncharacterized protein (TIGR03437 family)
MIKGTGLADGQASSSTSPLPQQLAGASVVIGGRLASLLYADETQVVGSAPFRPSAELISANHPSAR